MENSYTIKESLIYNTLYVWTVPQNIYQHKSFSSFWSKILKINPNEQEVWIQNWIIQNNPEWIISTLSIPI